MQKGKVITREISGNASLGMIGRKIEVGITLLTPEVGSDYDVEGYRALLSCEVRDAVEAMEREFLKKVCKFD